MAYTPYTPVTVSGYNQTVPPDDGSTGNDNQITWAGIKENLSDPLETAIESLDTNIATAFATRPFRASSTQASDYQLVKADYGKIIAASSSPTITLPDAASVGEGWAIGIVNVGSGMVYLEGSASQTINGLSGHELSNRNDYAWLMSDGSNFIGSVIRSVGEAGMAQFYLGASTARNGTLACDGNTIGNAASGATYAGEKYRTLFDRLKNGWGNLGTENFDSDDTVALPNAVDRMPIGGGSTYTWGATGGAATKTLVLAELPSVALGNGTLDFADSFGTTSDQHDHNFTDNGFGSHNVQGGSGETVAENASQADDTDSDTHSHTGSVSGAVGGNLDLGGSDTAFSLINPYFAGLWCVTY